MTDLGRSGERVCCEPAALIIGANKEMTKRRKRIRSFQTSNNYVPGVWNGLRSFRGMTVQDESSDQMANGRADQNIRRTVIQPTDS